MSGDGTASGACDSAIDSWLKPLALAPPEPPPITLSPGDRLGRYVLVDKLGRGATSTVFRARDSVLGRDVALKVLLIPPNGRADDFLREARSAARVQHPGLATVLDAGVEDGVRFIAFELVEGHSLRALVRRVRGGRPLEQARVLDLCEQIARAAEAAHAASVVHRDLKPENVVLAKNGLVKVLDFGLAAAIDSAHGWAGTPGYMAPELGGAAADARSDQFAIGVMLVELLTGERPPSRSVDGLPPSLRAIAQRALAEDPANRFPSAAALADALLVERERITARKGRGPLVLSALAALLVGPEASAPAAAGAPSPPLAVAAPVVACPPLATAPGEEWLGVAAASATCWCARA